MPFLQTNCVLFVLVLLSMGGAQAQVVEDFAIRFQTQQNGGIQFLANTSLYCGTGSQCVQAQNAMPITGFPQDNNNDHNMVYFNSDADPDTWSSSSDSLSLGICAEVSFAGLYWAGRLGNGFVANEALKDQVKIKAADGDAYIDVFAEESIDFDASNTDNYCCFADITEWASEQSCECAYTVANVVADQDDSSWGGWVLILVYADAAEPMRNLTVFDGLAMITSGWGGGGDNSTVDVPISGFLTPPFGPVDLKLGVVAYDGDRGSSGDQLGFDGTGIFQLHRRCHARHQQRIQQHPLHWRRHESMARSPHSTTPWATTPTCSFPTTQRMISFRTMRRTPKYA